MKRRDLLNDVATRVLAVTRPHPVRVAIDGVDGAGKTTFADELATVARRRGRSVIRATIDGFHNPRKIRYTRGRDSAEGYFLDSFDTDAAIRSLLEPLGPDGDREYRSAVFDYRTDSAVDTPICAADPDALLLFDGIFLHRPELRAFWDCSLFLHVRFDMSVPRMALRDGTDPNVLAPSNQRYVVGQALYLESCRPMSAATMVIDNNDLDAPAFMASRKDQSSRVLPDAPVSLRPITGENRDACLALHVADHQSALIATNARSLAQTDENPANRPLGIYVSNDPVGFLMYEPRDERTFLLHRIMIDRRHQGRGLGRRAIELLIEKLARHGDVTVMTSFRPENEAARRLFAGHGFVFDEIEADGEIVYRLDITG